MNAIGGGGKTITQDMAGILPVRRKHYPISVYIWRIQILNK